LLQVIFLLNTANVKLKMTIIADNPFNATPSLIGYLYQCRYALYASLNKLRQEEDFLISIESLDDIVFEKSGSPFEILQTKCQTVRPAILTNASPDLWRSIRIWCDGITNGRIPTESAFYLITTATASENSAAFLLKDGSKRDVSKAVEILDSTVESTNNRENHAAFTAYNVLSQPQKISLFKNVFIIDRSPTIIDLDKKLRQEVNFAVKYDQLDSFLDRLEGWWYRKIINQSNSINSILSSNELRLEIEHVIWQLREDNLPIDDDILKATIDATGFQDRIFVKQLKYFGLHDRRIFFAIENYFRANAQRSRWVDEYLVSGEEITNYDETLHKEWEIRNLQMMDDFLPDSSESEKKDKVKEIYKWVETSEHLPIRKCVTQPFVARGTFQILADKKRIIWHPDFDTTLDPLYQRGGKKI